MAKAATAGETVKTVEWISLRSVTPLKRGVNESGWHQHDCRA
jgi:hypothetical protein